MRATGIEKQGGGNTSRKFDNEKKERGDTNIYTCLHVSPQSQSVLFKSKAFVFMSLA